MQVMIIMYSLKSLSFPNSCQVQQEHRRAEAMRARNNQVIKNYIFTAAPGYGTSQAQLNHAQLILISQIENVSHTKHSVLLSAAALSIFDLFSK